jgi:hypothetical protein
MRGLQEVTAGFQETVVAHHNIKLSMASLRMRQIHRIIGD